MSRRIRLVSFVAWVIFGLGLTSALAQAEELPVAQDTPTDTTPFDGSETEDEVNAIVAALIAIAVVTALLLLAFLWHTSPRRRLRVAQRRADRIEAQMRLDPEIESDAEIEPATEADPEADAEPNLERDTEPDAKTVTE